MNIYRVARPISGRLATAALVLALSGIAFPALAADGVPMAKPEDVGMSSKRLERLTAIMQRFIDDDLLAGTVTLVARRGKVVHFEAQGYRHKEANEPMTKDTIFVLMSMTKPIVSTALMMLYEEGHFLLDDPISNYLPEFADKQVIVTDEDGNTSEFSQLKRPVLVAPGIGGSWLKGANGDFIWIPVALTTEGKNDLLARMAMNPNGSELENLTDDGILEFIPPENVPVPPALEFLISNVYGEQLRAIQNAGYPGTTDRWLTSTGTPAPVDALENDLWRFASDWRLNQKDLADDMKDRVEWLTSNNPEIARSCEVDIVSHSNGGVIAATYVMSYPEHSRDRVHRLLTSAAPYLGAVRAIGAHTNGYIFGIEENLKFAPDWGRMIEMARNLPATYSLLPGRTYWDASSQFEIGSTAIMEDLNGNLVSGFDATVEFMTRSKLLQGLGRNASVWSKVGSEVNDIIDDWRQYDRPPHIFRQVGATRQDGQDIVHTVVGWYNDPMAVKRKFNSGDVRIEPGDVPLHIVYRAAQMPIIGLGDTTVPLSSATLGRDPRVGKMDFSGVQRPDQSDNPWIEEFEIFPCTHVGMVEDACVNAEGVGALDRTVEILKTGYLASSAQNAPGKKSQFATTAAIKQNLVYISGTAHIGVHVEEPGGNHSGPETQDGFKDIEYLIREIGYYPTDFGAVVSLPDQKAYTFTVRAVDSETTIRVVRILAEGSADRDHILFPDVVVQTGGGLRFVLQNGVTPESLPLDIDQDGDGAYEGSLIPAATITSASLAPAIPKPIPLRVDQSVLITEPTDTQVQVAFSNVGPGDWTWTASATAEWVTLAAAAGPVSTAIDLTLKSTTLPEGLYSDSLTVSVSTGAFTVSHTVVIDLEVVSERALSSITISPPGISLAPGETQQFVAEGKDQIGDPFGFTPVWSATGGTIDQTGLYTAGLASGDFQITAADQSDQITGSIAVTIIGPTGVEDDNLTGEIPEFFDLYQNYPNPFNPVTQIIFDVRATTNVLLTVFDIMGRKVRTLVNQERPPGRYSVRFDAANLPSGPYLLRIQMDGFTKTITMIVLK